MSRLDWALCKEPYSSRFFLTPQDTKGSLAINSSMSRFSHSFTYQSNKYLNVHVSGILGKQGRHNPTLMELNSSRDGQYTHIHLSQLIVCMHWNLPTALKVGYCCYHACLEL